MVELFMLDFLPHKAFPNVTEVRALPRRPSCVGRFTLTKRGLEERWIAQTERAVSRSASEFRRAATDDRSFGPPKAITNAMLADGIGAPRNTTSEGSTP